MITQMSSFRPQLSSGAYMGGLAPGSMILCQNGPKSVGELKAGDVVQTVDAGPQPICNVYSRPRNYEDQSDNPIMIDIDALGNFRPSQSLVVAASQLLLLGRLEALSSTEAPATLVPAVLLAGEMDARYLNSRLPFNWWHIALSAPALIIANGAVTRSDSLESVPEP